MEEGVDDKDEVEEINFGFHTGLCAYFTENINKVEIV